MHQSLMSPETTGPVANGADAEVDLEILKVVPKQFAIVDERSANWLIRKIVAAREYGERVKEWAERERRRAEREETTLLFLFGRQIETWTKAEIENLNGRRKSICLPAGTVGFRQRPARLIVKDEGELIAWARNHCPSAVHVLEKLVPSAVTEHFATTGELPPGAELQPATDSFYVK